MINPPPTQVAPIVITPTNRPISRPANITYNQFKMKIKYYPLRIWYFQVRKITRPKTVITCKDAMKKKILVCALCILYLNLRQSAHLLAFKEGYRFISKDVKNGSYCCYVRCATLILKIREIVLAKNRRYLELFLVSFQTKPILCQNCVKMIHVTS